VDGRISKLRVNESRGGDDEAYRANTAVLDVGAKAARATSGERNLWK